MSCSLDKTRDLAKRKNIINNFNELKDGTSETLQKFHAFNKSIKELGLTKYPGIIKDHNQPMRLEGNKVVFSKGFFVLVDRENSRLSAIESRDKQVREDISNREGENISYNEDLVGNQTLTEVDRVVPIDDSISNYEMINIIKDNGTESEKELASLLSSYIDETAPVYFQDELSTPKTRGEFGYTKGKSSSIYIKNSTNNKARVYLHELSHEVTVRQLDQYKQDKSKLNQEQIEAIENLIKVYETSKSKLDTGEYGFKNVAEFISETFSNEEFQAKLNSLEYENTSVLSKILEFISKLLGIKEGTALSETFNEMFRLVQNTQDVNKLGRDSNKVQLEDTKQLDTKEQYLQRRISKLTKDLALATSETKKDNIRKELEYTRERYLASQDTSVKNNVYQEFGEHTLDLAQQRIESLEKGLTNDLGADLEYINDVLDVWDDFVGLRDKTGKLRYRIQDLMNKWETEEVNKYYPSEKPITIEEIKGQNKDISTLKGWTGALLDIPNYRAYVIGSLIRTSQDSIERKSNQIYNEIEEKVKELSKKSGKDIQKIYDEVIYTDQDTGRISLTVMEEGLSDTALEFHEFYRSKMKELMDLTPTLTRKNAKGELETFELNEYFIPNVTKDESSKEIAKRLKSTALGLIKERKIGDTTRDEEQKADIINLDYIRSIPADKKSRDLGNSLFLFAQSMYNYDEMSRILPKVRLLQREIEKTSYIQGSNPNITKTGKDSNMWKITEAFIKAQVKGERKEEQGRSITWNRKTDDKGVTTENYLDITGTMDNLLKWNSLLRIGLSPIGVSANVSFGKLSNFMEAIGGRFFTRKHLRQAELIFWKQTFDKDSVLNKELLEKYNILQELTDYDSIKTSKMGKGKYLTADGLQEMIYAPQKASEKWIQSATLMATMIKEEYMTSDGKLTDKFNNASSKEKDLLFTKITGINNSLHGRYSPKEAAAMHQNIIYRSAMQFRKWIPAAIEARFDKKHMSPRLGVEVEGRYRTFTREFLLKLAKGDVTNAFYNLMMPLVNAKAALASGKLTETDIYNMRKMLVESILAVGTLVMVAGMKGGSDEEKKRRRKQAWFKSSMLLLNRISGDLNFFYSPEQGNNLLKNAAPVSKLVDDLLGVASGIPEAFMEDTKTSKKKKPLSRKILGLVPGSKVIIDPARIMSEEALQELN